MQDIRWLDIPAGDREASNHPAGIFIDRQQYSVIRVLQVRFGLKHGDWCDVPIVNYIKGQTSFD